MESKRASLVVVATPIGNLGDFSPRAHTALGDCDFWVVEDTRISGKLQSHFGLKKPMKILNDHSSPNAVTKIVESLKAGEQACLVTDGGTPVISDPGTLLIDACHNAGLEVDGIPGPSAVTHALALSGFFGQRYAFLGFLGRKAGDIRKELEPYRESPITLVLFESPQRMDALLEVAGEVLGPRRYAICREMTKQYQQIYRNVLPGLAPETLMTRKGEVTIVIEGRRKSLRATS